MNAESHHPDAYTALARLRTTARMTGSHSSYFELKRFARSRARRLRLESVALVMVALLLLVFGTLRLLGLLFFSQTTAVLAGIAASLGVLLLFLATQVFARVNHIQSGLHRFELLEMRELELSNALDWLATEIGRRLEMAEGRGVSERNRTDV